MRFVTVESAKERAPLDALCAHLGIALDEQDRAACPFHDDSDPSFYLWGDGRMWWCQPCGFGGDQIDLLRRLRGLGFADAVAELDRIADQMPQAPPRARRAREPVAEQMEIARVVSDAMERASRPQMDGYMSLYAVGYVVESDARPDDRLVWDRMLRSLGWGIDDLGRVVMPYWAGREQRLTGAKLRAPVTGERSAVPGSVFDRLYLDWLEPKADRVILCEGETDCAWAVFHATWLDVRGLPRGAGAPVDPAWVESLGRWPRVYLAFDGDEAGRRATDRWADALDGMDVRVCEVPDGRDLRSARIPLGQLLSGASEA